MKVINLNSKFELTQSQISFAESVIICGEDEPIRKEDSISVLMNEIPVFLVNKETQDKCENGDIDTLGFYQHSASILGVKTPVVGLCLEKIVNAVSTDEELIILIAKVLIHEFAHAKMRLHPNANYRNVNDDFYKWMEEPMANVITLEYFKNFDICYGDRYYRYGRKNLAYATTLISPFNYVKDYISKQPDNYRLGLDLFEHRVCQWWIWRNQKEEIEKRDDEKKEWLDYVKYNVGKTDKTELDKLFEKLHK